MGAFAFAQVSKTDTINKTAVRKVLNNDIKNVPQDAETKKNIGNIKWNGDKKTSENSNGYLKMTNQVAQPNGESVIQKGKESSVSGVNHNNPVFKKVMKKIDVDSTSENTNVKGGPYMKMPNAK